MYEMTLSSTTWTLTCDGAWTLDCDGHKVASWTLKGGRLPSIQAVLKAQRCYLEWEDFYGFDPYVDWVPFRTYRDTL